MLFIVINSEKIKVYKLESSTWCKLKTLKKRIVCVCMHTYIYVDIHIYITNFNVHLIKSVLINHLKL